MAVHQTLDAGDRRIDDIVIHCAATRPHQDVGAAEIRRWHVEENGWKDIGYHYVIRRNGKIETGRPVSEAGAHVAGHNARSIGVCLVGGLDETGKPSGDHYTDRQWEALHDLVSWMAAKWPRARVLGHRDFPGVTKACPCFDVSSWWSTEHDPKALEQRKLGQSRTIRAGIGTLVVGTPVLAESVVEGIATYLPQGVAAAVQIDPWFPGWAKIALPIVVICGILVVLYARWDDWRNGKR